MTTRSGGGCGHDAEGGEAAFPLFSRSMDACTRSPASSIALSSPSRTRRSMRCSAVDEIELASEPRRALQRVQRAPTRFGIARRRGERLQVSRQLLDQESRELRIDRAHSSSGSDVSVTAPSASTPTSGSSVGRKASTHTS